MNYDSLLQRDFKSAPAQPKLRLRRAHVLGAIALSAVLGLGLVLASHDAAATRHPTLSEPSPDVPGGTARVTIALSVPTEPERTETAPASEPEAANAAWTSVTVKGGDSLASIFSRLKLSPRDVHDIVRLDETTARLRQLLPGQEFRFLIDSENVLQEMVYRVSALESLHIVRTGESFHSTLIERNTEKRVNYAHGTIDSSLFVAGQNAGLSDNLIMEMAAVFGWDIDFALDIRGGDEFSVLYEEHYLDGEKLRDGAIVAAEFINQGRRYQAVRYEDPQGRANYFTPEGLSMRKAFLRTPVEFSRISSRFGARRHPVLNTIRSHKGVDYAAPRGTPIKAAGDGKVVFVGRKGGYGKTVVLQHGERYSTLYAHMSGFARGIRNGTYVSQGRTIGYVGKTGLATGDHLHYEFRVAGVHRNPLTVRLPDAAPIAATYKTEFTAHAERLVRQLDTRRASRVAMNSN